MTPRLFSAALVLLACFLGTASCFSQSFRFERSADLTAHYCEACVQYASKGLTSPWQNVTVRLDPTPAAGHTTSFHIVVDSLHSVNGDSGWFSFLQTEGPEASSVRLVFYWDGYVRTAGWVLTIGDEEIALGDSAILPGSGKHTVTFMTAPDRVVIVEDAVVIATPERPYSAYVTPSFDLMLADMDASVKAALTEMTFQPGFLPPPPEVAV